MNPGQDNSDYDRLRKIAGEPAPRQRLVDDHNFVLRYPSGHRYGACRVQIFAASGHQPVVVATWVPADGGVTPANAPGQYASAVWAQLLPDSDEPPIWVHRLLIGAGLDNYWVVSFTIEGRYKLTRSGTRILTAEMLAGLVGTEVDGTRGTEPEPGPEPTEMLIYDTRWVWRLPRPAPFRQPDCMPAPTSRWWDLGRLLVPDARPRDCCWYHGGNWHYVSQLAIRLVRAAVNAGIEPDDRENHVMANAQQENLSPWETRALRSLVNPADGIVVDTDEQGSSLRNGQHRVRAMLDAGVRRTVTIRHWEEPADPDRPNGAVR